MTDSGGIQEETTALGLPCLTLRNNTERPITIVSGTNQLAGSPPVDLPILVQDILSKDRGDLKLQKFWDGCTAERIVEVLMKS